MAEAVTETILATMKNHFGNASSVHSFGQTAKSIIDAARGKVADLIGATPQEIVFTSGGTESNNLALRGVTGRISTKKRRIIVSAIEHEAVLKTVKDLDEQRWSISLVPADSDGLILPEELEKMITSDTALVSVMHANNEIGTIQPIKQLAEIAHNHGALFHVDAVQSAGKLPISVKTLGVDLLSLSAHKFNGPKGVGALWIKRGLRLSPHNTGGRQERSRRAGTENVPALSGFGVAADIAKQKLVEHSKTIGNLRDRLESGILSAVSGTVVNGTEKQRIANTTNISFDRIEAESLLIALDLEGIAVSTGSACSSGTLEPSHVLKAMGLSPHRTQSSIRFSLGLGNSQKHIDHAVEIMPRVVDRLRRLSFSGLRQ
tara:strand:- start:607 stop:1731 length:1125 start_codon:yes stop_codon:yes gene_type:complete